MGSFRWGHYAPFRDSSLGCVAVVGTLVPGLVGWNLVTAARLVPRDVGVRSPRPYRAAQFTGKFSTFLILQFQQPRTEIA